MKLASRYTKDFRAFLQEFRIVTAAIGFIFALATNDLVQSLVNNIVMPLLDPLIKDGTWETASWNFFGATIAWGPFLGTLLRFILLCTIIYVAIKKLLKYEPLR